MGLFVKFQRVVSLQCRGDFFLEIVVLLMGNCFAVCLQVSEDRRRWGVFNVMTMAQEEFFFSPIATDKKCSQT